MLARHRASNASDTSTSNGTYLYRGSNESLVIYTASSMYRPRGPNAACMREQLEKKLKREREKRNDAPARGAATVPRVHCALYLHCNGCQRPLRVCVCRRPRCRSSAMASPLTWMLTINAIRLISLEADALLYGVRAFVSLAISSDTRTVRNAQLVSRYRRGWLPRFTWCNRIEK